MILTRKRLLVDIFLTRSPAATCLGARSLNEKSIRSKRNHSYKNVFCLLVHFHGIQTHLNTEGFA